MQRGERIAKKTKSAIKTALLQLIHETSYPQITVLDNT